jgi:hypothetical protein
MTARIRERIDEGFSNLFGETRKLVTGKFFEVIRAVNLPKSRVIKRV